MTKLRTCHEQFCIISQLEPVLTHKTRGSILYFCIAVLKEANSKKSKLNLYIDFLAFNSICLRLSFIELSQKASEGDS